MTKLEEKREKRRKQSAEIFTPPDLVNDMLGKLPIEVWENGKTFCDPACGNGNFLIWVLLKKIAKGHKPLEALKTIYGCDIMKDNIEECRKRLLKIVSIFEPISEDHLKSIFINIRFLSRTNYPNGSLDYDFSFKNKVNNKDIDRWLNWIQKEQMLDNVELPIETTEKKNRKNDMFANDIIAMAFKICDTMKKKKIRRKK